MSIMNNPFLYSNSNKRYHTLDYYLKNKYRSKVAKISLNANFSCPNRDGKVSYGGCSFCSSLGSGDYAGDIKKNLNNQFIDIKAMMDKKWDNCQYIAYFQAYSNTYADVAMLKSTFEPFINKEGVVALAIATRPDCLNKEIIEYLQTIAERTDLWIELGLQTIFDATARNFNRGYDLDCFINSINILRHHNLDIVVHLINGLPYETTEMMVESAKLLGQMDIQGLKIHMLHLLKNTKMGQQYLNKEFSLISRQEYIETVIKQLEYLNPKIVIHRLTGDGKVEDLLAPHWTIKKVTVLNDIDKLMKEKESYQGKHFIQTF